MAAGTVPATTKIKHIRSNLNENLASDNDLILPGAGTVWLNSDLLEYLNKAKDRACSIVRQVREDYFQVTGATLSLVANTKEYSLATGARQLVGAKITTSGYEYMRFRAVSQSTREFQERDAVPAGDASELWEMIYDIIGVGKIKFADYPPRALTMSYDYIAQLADYTLATDSVLDINDEWREFEEAYATRLALIAKVGGDPRVPIWDNEIKRLEPILIKMASKRQIRESEYVEPF